MKHRIAALLLISAGLIGTAGCGRSPRVLHVYNWADYIDDALIAEFEQQEHCRVRVDTFDSNEAMYAKMRAGGGGYDLIFPSSYQVETMQQQGMLQAIRHDLLPNLANVDPEVLKSALNPEMTYSVPYTVSYTGLAYRKDRVAEFEPSWAALDRIDLKGRITLLNDMREAIGAGLKFLGYSLNTTNVVELEQARDVVVRWKRNIAKFENEQYKTGLASGEFSLVQGYSGDIVQIQEDNPEVVFVLPNEGFSFTCDEMAIPKDARDPELAHRFIDFLLQADKAARNIAFIGYLCPVRPAYDLLDAETRANPAIFPPAEIRAKGEVIRNLGNALPLYTRIWDDIKAAD